MYFIDIKALKADAISGKFSFGPATHYFVWWLALAGVSGREIDNNQLLAFLSITAIIIVHVICLYWCAKKYRSSDSDSFFKLFFPVAWVVGWRIGLMLIVLIIPIYFLVSCFSGALNSLPLPASVDKTSMALIRLVVELGATIFYYWRIGVHLGEIAGANITNRSNGGKTLRVPPHSS